MKFSAGLRGPRFGRHVPAGQKWSGMNTRRMIWAVVACALATVVWAQVAAAQTGEGPLPAKCYSVDTGETYTTSDPFLQWYFDFVIAEHSGTLYVYEGPDATTITGYTAWPDNDGDYLLPGREAFSQVIDGDDDLVDFIYYPPGDLSYRVDTYVIAAGCAGPSAFEPPDNVQVCESPGFSDNLFTLQTTEYAMHKAGLTKPVATPGYTPQGQNSGYAGKLGLKCLGKPVAQKDVGVEVGSGAILHGPQFDPAFNPGTYGLAA